jgi:hypothetical protein
VDHGYSTNVGIISRGTAAYPLQEVAAFVFLTQEESTVLFYQLVSDAATDHFYTISETEKDAALADGYVLPAADPPTFIYPTQVCGSTPFYRLYSKTGKDNLHTTPESERLEFITNGYTDIEIAGYVLPTTAAQCAFS